MARIRKLTIYDIVEAFPSECETILPRELHRIKKHLEPWLDHLEDIKEDYINDFERHFFTLLVEIEMPYHETELYKKLLKIKKLHKDRKTRVKKGLPEQKRLDVEKAKNVPVEGLYDFEKQRVMRKYIMALCPFHNEKTPSFYIYNETNRYHCFGCGADGDSIDFIMKLNNLDFIGSVKYLRG